MNQEFQIIDEKDFREIHNLKNKNSELNRILKSTEQQNLELHRIIELMKTKIESLQNELELNKNIINSMTKSIDIESNIDNSTTPCINQNIDENINDTAQSNTSYIKDCLTINIKMLFECCCSTFYKINKNDAN
jgi:hypothetical protein